MYYYEVLVASQRYHGAEALTYSDDQKFIIGQIVVVPFGRQTVVGIVQSIVEKPTFEVKQIIKAVSPDPLPTELLSLHNWLAEYYPGPLGFITQLFVPSSLTRSSKKRLDAVDKPLVSETLPTLNEDQRVIVEEISAKHGSFLLRGETGSGKTRIYQELARLSLDQGRSCIVLTPEIGLTSQLSESFDQAFPGKVVVTHSGQTVAEKRNAWLRILAAQEPLIVIGPRSTLFSPLKDVGLIVLDEAHDTSYKQEQMPYYQATRVAAKLAELHKAKLILGSATPTISDYYIFRQKKLPILHLQKVAVTSSAQITTEVVDLKDRSNFTRSPWLSNQIISSVEAALHNKQQSMLFLNRRGTARLVLCKNCGWQAVCPRCDLPLTYHGDSHNLRCHTCGFTTNPMSSCPNCSSTDIQFKSIGTKTIMDEVMRLFPRAIAERFDSDNPKSDSLVEQFSKIKDGNVDIIVGTQVVSKGLDLPKLATVGLIAADTSLYFPDFSAEERSFQMIRQVIGRVGRGHIDGHIVVQTYHPDSITLNAAVNREYEQFYESQISERELYRFPPLYFVLKIGIERRVQSSAKQVAQDLSQKLLQQGLQIEINGPSPAFIEKSHGSYKWQLIVKAKQRSELLKIIKLLPKQVSYDIDPTNLL